MRRENVISCLSRVPDFERILNRIRLGLAVPRELVTLKAGLESASELLSLFKEEDAQVISWLVDAMQPCDDVETV